MEIGTVIVLALGIIWFVHKGQKARAADVARLIYFTSVKRAVDTCGFVGSPLDTHEAPAEVGSLYYLGNLKYFNRLSHNLRFALTEFSGAHPEFELIGVPDKLIFRITFETDMDNSHSKGVLILNYSEVDELGNSTFSSNISSVYAPTHYFNQTNLKMCLQLFLGDIELIRHKKIERYSLIFGAEHPELERVCGLPKLTRESPKRCLKKAKKFIEKGYTHSIA